MSTWSVTSDWRSRTKAQLLEDVYALIEMRDREIAKREQAEAVADSMQHFADVAEVCERKSNEYAARLARVEALADRWERAGDVMLTAIQGLTFAPRVDGATATLLAAHDELRAALTEETP